MSRHDGDGGPGDVHSISPAPTSIAAFVGRTPRGRPNEPRQVTSLSEFAQEFGEFSPDHPLAAAVRDYFENGGAAALILKLVKSDAPADAPLDLAAFQGDGLSTGLHALRRAEIFNLLCLPPDLPGAETSIPAYAEALRVCADCRAILLLDAFARPGARPGAGGLPVDSDVEALRNALGSAHLRNAAVYFPRLVAPEPQSPGRVQLQVPCGAVAGVIARMDRKRGVWKAPAGTEAAILGVQGPSVTLSDSEAAQLNALGVNSLRASHGPGTVIWGARTLVATESGHEFKYLPVRRLALFIESSVDRGTAWAAFEPNAEPVWTELRASIDAFMLRLYRDGALAGTTPAAAFFVRCGRETMTQADLDSGILNIEIGFAPLRPAEFVILRIQRTPTGSS